MGGLNDALNLVKKSINGPKGLLNGTNLPTQPKIGDLFGFNIQGVPLISTRDYFLTQLESWVTSIPLRSQWVVLIQPFPSCINSDIIQGLEYTGGNKKNFDVNQAYNILASYPLQSVNGCLFAQSVKLPSETMSVQNNSINVDNNRGFLPGILGSSRDKSQNLTINFLETNTSFTDFVIRPWVIASEHFGYVARENDSGTNRDIRNVKSTMYVLEYSRTYQHVAMIPKKTWVFYNCVPTSVESYTLDYKEAAEATSIITSWTYTNYAISNSLYLPLPNIIDRVTGILKGNFPKISPLQTKSGVSNLKKTLRNPAALF